MDQEVHHFVVGCFGGLVRYLVQTAKYPNLYLNPSIGSPWEYGTSYVGYTGKVRIQLATFTSNKH